jgi:hypothetical protein
MNSAMLYQTALVVHAGCMLAALLSFAAGELLLIPARRGKRRPAWMALRAGRSGNLLLNVGVLGGIVLVFVGGWRLLTPWLLESFAVIAIALAVRAKLVAPWEAQARSALEGGSPVAAIKAFASQGSALAGRTAVIALFGIVAALMTLKP